MPQNAKIEKKEDLEENEKGKEIFARGVLKLSAFTNVAHIKYTSLRNLFTFQSLL
jgi:hypothetical protein